MKTILTAFGIVQGAMAVLFAVGALVLTAVAANVGWDAASAGLGKDTGQEIIEAIGLLAAAVVALQIAQTITEEEVVRTADISAPTRVRRFLSRFLVVLVVALAIEALVATFKAVHENVEHLLYAGALIAGVGVLLASWGLFVWLNRSAEELEPEAMAKAKQEDRKLE